MVLSVMLFLCACVVRALLCTWRIGVLSSDVSTSYLCMPCAYPYSLRFESLQPVGALIHNRLSYMLSCSLCGGAWRASRMLWHACGMPRPPHTLPSLCTRSTILSTLRPSPTTTCVHSCMCAGWGGEGGREGWVVVSATSSTNHVGGVRAVAKRGKHAG